MKALNLDTGLEHDVDDIDIENNIILLKDNQTLIRQFLHKVTLFDYNRNQKRPVVSHEHIREELIVIENAKNVVLGIKNDSEVGYKPFCVIPNSGNRKEDVATAKLFTVSDSLIQVAEMYCDYMLSLGQKGTLPYQITLDVLNKYSLKL